MTGLEVASTRYSGKCGSRLNSGRVHCQLGFRSRGLGFCSRMFQKEVPCPWLSKEARYPDPVCRSETATRDPKFKNCARVATVLLMRWEGENEK